MRAPKCMDEDDLSPDLARQLVEERQMRNQLANELEQSRRENEELRAGLSAQDTGSNTDNPNLDFDAPARFSSTRQMASIPGGYRSLEDSRFLCSMNQLSVASINVPECKAVDNDQIHRQTFEQWKDLLVDSMKLAGIEEESTMYTVFKVKAGPSLLEIFRNTQSQADAPDEKAAPFSNAMHRLKTYFGSGSDIMLMRRRLALMTQKHDESDLNFIIRVGSLARLCEYDSEKEFEEIVATVAERARNRDVRMASLKMLSRKGNFTDLIDKVRELEAIRLNEEYVMQKQGKQLEQPDHALVAPVMAPIRPTQNWEPIRFARGSMNNRGYRGRGSWRTPRGRHPFLRAPYHHQPFSQSGERCWRCNSFSHSANSCNARDRTCNKCGVVGHILRACTAGSYKRSAQEGMEVSPAKIAAVEKIEEVSAGTDSVSVGSDNL